MSVIQGVEVMCAAQGIEARAPLKTSQTLQTVVARLREVVPSLGADRYMAPDMGAATALVQSGALVQAAGAEASL